MRKIAISIGDIVKTVLQGLAGLSRWQKQFIVFLIDMALLFQSIWIAYSLRIGQWILWDQAIAKLAIAAILLAGPIFFFTGVYHTIFRYVGIGMLRTLARALTYYGTAMALVFTIWGVAGVPRTTGIMQPIIYFILVVGVRVIARFLMVDVLRRSAFGGEVKRVLVYGAGDAGQQLVSALRTDPGMDLCGYIDDDRLLAGQRLDGMKVYWSGKLADIIRQARITDILLAMPNINRKRRRQIVRALGDLKVGVQILPQIKDIVGGKVTVSDIRPLEIEDLLGREPVAANELLLGRTTSGKNVLVTGAGGSIGSELCRQICRLGARSLVLFEISEFSLYAILEELRLYCTEHNLPELEIIPALGSVTDRKRLEEMFARHRVQTVYHAAAYKHVPLVEANPLQAIRNNIGGTFEIVRAAHAAKVSDFILISTDKAVRPTNVMGATKRAAEQILQGFAKKSRRTNFSMVRFGNVLGSSGSVVPLFRQQWEAGGPITLTDRRITRYFMTIPEAATLVIQAAGMAKGDPKDSNTVSTKGKAGSGAKNKAEDQVSSGQVFVLDMGSPVKIFDLARDMIHLSGLSLRDKSHPDGDIEIVEVGLRPGEKLYEELLIGKDPRKTTHPRILMANEGHIPWAKLQQLLTQLDDCRDIDPALAILQQIVPDFDHGRDNPNPPQAKGSAA